MNHIAEAPRTHVQSAVVAMREGFKIIRVKIPAGEGLPPHHAVGLAAIVVVGGEGIIKVLDTEYSAEPGAVIEVPDDAEHAVTAVQDLDILLIRT